MVLSHGGGHGSDNRPRHSGRFSGTSSGGRDSYGRGHPPKPFQLALQVSHGNSYGSGHQMQYFDQQFYSAPPAPISAPPLQSFRGGHSGRHGQQSQQPRACYTCGDVGHIARFCPRAPSSSQHQSSHAMVQAPSVPGRGRGARGGGRVARGGAQTARGGGQLTAGRPREVVQGVGAQTRCYALPAMPEVEVLDAVTTGTVLVCDRDASVLFDPGSTYS
ncbi:uncharacterized protein [Nicotiana sylvestris]